MNCQHSYRKRCFMKKFLLVFMLAILSISMVGCNKKMKIEDCISEQTKIYFQAETENVKGSLCVGEREENFIYDGVHTKNVDFTLITLKFKVQPIKNAIETKLTVNDVEKDLLLELNPMNHTYMADLGYLLKADDKISLSYDNIVLNFENISKNFKIQYNDAVKIALDEFGDDLKQFYSKGNFQGECYLQVFDFNNDNNLFWTFSIFGKNKKVMNVVIDVKDGSIYLKF